MDRPRALKTAGRFAGRTRVRQRDLLFVLIDSLLSRLARTGAIQVPRPMPAIGGGRGEADILRRLSPHPHQARKNL
jgi:DNA polymerase-3 subunit delta'